MSLDADIERLRTSLSGCSLVAFGDASTRLMLRASQEKACHREYLDELCAQAANCFEVMGAVTETSGNVDQHGEQACEAIVLTSKNTRIFVKSEAEASDFLCCVCDTPRDLDAVVKAAKETLCKIVGSY